MKAIKFMSNLSRRRGIALITVIGALALATVLLLAMFSVTQSEFKSTQSYSAGQSARELADGAVNIVISQIHSGSQQDSSLNGRQFHATQPGAVRKYSADGAFMRGYKLYSDSNMVVTTAGVAGEKEMAQAVPPTDWDSEANKGRYVDLNDPVVRYATGAGSNTDPVVFFPIVDPRSGAKVARDDDRVEGFSYYTECKSKPGAVINGVVLPTAAMMAPSELAKLRVPMPVEWLYTLQDGSVGTLDASRKFVSASGTVPTAANPIVGRVAFWADDESCKININTASEPTYWGVPITYHERAHEWAEKPPTMNEYQRYPGHPATVSLSTVLLPNTDLDAYGKSQPEVTKIIEMKNMIYKVIPKINNGGSICGTLPYEPDDVDRSQASVVDLAASLKERLYASLDEMLFSEQMQNSLRQVNDLQYAGTSLITPETLDRGRFFLTASSRSPEFSMLGVPRVAMWPIADESKGKDHRTIFDSLIAFCATLRPDRGTSTTSDDRTYFIRRKDAHSADVDLAISRNKKLLEYLYKMMQAKYPAGGVGTGASYETKYGAKDAHQILIEIFDYIRSTNLQDSYLADPSNLEDMRGKTAEEIYAKRDAIRGTFKTYTEPRYKTLRTTDQRGHAEDIPDKVVANNFFPGGGQVTPSHWNTGGNTYMGFGRNVTVSEVALHFIATADGKKDDGSYVIWNKVGANYTKSIDPNDKSGGRTCAKIDANAVNTWTQLQGPNPVGTPFPSEKYYWYSNFPPYPSARKYGTDPAKPATDPRHPRNHPGYDPANWNATLDQDVALKEDEKRIQAALHIEMFCPAVGWNGFSPELTFVVKGTAVSAIQVNGTALFNTTADVQVKTGNNPFISWSAHPLGSTASFRNLSEDRRVKAVRKMPQDFKYDPGAGGSPHSKLLNMDLVSGFLTVKRDQYMTFEIPEPIVIDVYDTHDWQGKEPMQTINVKFPAGSHKVRTPDLVVVSSEHRHDVKADGSIYDQRAVDGPRWWAFNYGGALGRYTGTASRYVLDPNSINPLTTTPDIRTSGRFRQDDHLSVASTIGTVPASQSLIYGYDPNNTDYKGVKYVTGPPGNPDIDDRTKNYGSDIIRSVIPRYGDYRLVAARRVVPGDIWEPHPLWSNSDAPFAHNLTSFFSDAEPGFDRSGQAYGANDGQVRRLVSISGAASASYTEGKIPDMPQAAAAAQAAANYGDFDNAPGNCRDGGYINKPDEGNFSTLHFWIANDVRLMRNAYYFDSWESEVGGKSYFTPNRMIASPGMFGSLSTGVWGSMAPGNVPGAGTTGVPWRTLLFRPHTQNPGNGGSLPALPVNQVAGAATPKDHYLMDLFFMPVVEPYAISEPLSTAGRINVNYQMLPFTHIRRATGLSAVLKGELMAAIPKVSMPKYLTYPVSGTATWPQRYWTENPSQPAAEKAVWYRKIDRDETLKQLDERFNFETGVAQADSGLLRSASQFCEIHLVPDDISSSTGVSYTDMNVAKGQTPTTRPGSMAKFWDAHALTGDNMRERPYTNIYSKITSRSNTFRVHFRAQVIKKARSTAPDVFDPAKDLVASEYRGSTLIERYIDPNEKDPAKKLPDYATAGDPTSVPSLDSFYRFRVLENKRFAP